jgi:hypothetical protein
MRRSLHKAWVPSYGIHPFATIKYRILGHPRMTMAYNIKRTIPKSSECQREQVRPFTLS